jgi:hypothetical protein
MLKFFTLFGIVLSLSVFAKAQQSTGKLIDVDYKNAGIVQVTADLHSKTGYRFFYDPIQFDSLQVTLNLNQKSLNQVLDKLFENTAYHYVITGDNEVILTKTWQITATLPPGFFKAAGAENSTAHTPDVADYTAEADKNIALSTTANKLYVIGPKTIKLKPGKATIAGYVRDSKSGEPVAGASIYDEGTKSGIATDQFGYFSISLPRGYQVLSVKGIGMRDIKLKVMLYADGKLNVELEEQVTSLKEVKISDEKVANVKRVEMGVTRLDIKDIKNVPTVFGESDILRVVLTLPGVQSVGEATTGFNVRGGSADENLILLNGSTIYNPSHFFGFFSAFNSDIVKSVDLYKSSIPEKYGGRLSSVLDVTDREGNKKIFTGSAGIGLITSRFNIEGPIVKDKTSFIFGARTTYSDWLLHLLPPAYSNSSASFYDINFDISHTIDDKNNLYITTYLSHDYFRLNSDTAYSYSNKNINVKWKHNFNNKLYSVVSTGLDDYGYDISSSANPIDAYKLSFDVRQTNFKADFTYYLDSKNTIDFGLNSIYYSLSPGSYQPLGAQSLTAPNVVPNEQALESALYFGDKFDISPDFSVSAGLRFSLYDYLGPQTVDYYAPNSPRTSTTVLDSTTYKKGQVVNSYHAPEIRISARYNLSDDLSLKASYNTLEQYIHLLSNSVAISPIDVYKLSDPNIKPEEGDQVSLGIYKNLQSNNIETSVEVYYKNIKNYIDFKSGADLLLNQHIEQDVINTDGKAYGVEFLLKKTTGKLNGWISYTYSRTFLRQDDPYAGTLINNGDYYPANYDKPNDFNFNGNYKVSHRFSLSLDVTYSTGRPITYPIAEYEYEGAEKVLYSNRNEYRIPDYFRTDFSMNIDGNHKVHQKFHNSWTIGVYNLTGRANAYSTFFAQQGGLISGYQLSIFAKPIPFVNYNIRF